jgi:hypothetical protein
MQISPTDKFRADTEAELARLAKSRPPRQFDFAEIGKQIVASLRKAADDQITEAQNLRASVEVLAEGITAQLDEHARLLANMDERMRDFGADIVEAHKKMLSNGADDAK